MKRALIISSSIFISCIIFTVVLFLFSDQPNRKPNHFQRQFTSLKIKLKHRIPTTDHSYMITGHANGSYFFSDEKAPFHLLISDQNLAQIKDMVVSFPMKTDPRAARLYFTESYFYVIDYNKSLITKGTLSDWSTVNTLVDTISFIDALPINNSTIIVRKANPQNGEFILGSIDLGTLQTELFPSLLEKQIDGRFCTDGQLHYDAFSSRVVYVYFYRNQFISMDDHLNTHYRAHTIDTISHVRLEIDNIDSEHSVTLSSPPFVVNRISRVDHGLLFIHNGLKADNEESNDFGQHSVIDVYTLSNGNYLHSFYIPHEDGQKMKDFLVTDHTLMATFPESIASYSLPSY